MPWLALSAEVEPGWADAFSDALLWAGAESAAIEAPDSPAPRVTALLPHDRRADALVAAAAAHCGLAAPPRFAVEPLADDDWVRRTQSQFAPVEVGRLWIGASWHAQPVEPRILVRLDPGLAFGTGTHPSTRIVLEYVEHEVHGGETVLDYGCGSGILAIAAAKLGARRVAAVDVDAQALTTAADNARRNSVAVEVCSPEALAPGAYDIVVSNILAQPLIVLAPLLISRTAPGGRLALAGLLAEQSAEVAAAYAPSVRLDVARRAGDWVLLAGRRR